MNWASIYSCIWSVAIVGSNLYFYPDGFNLAALWVLLGALVWVLELGRRRLAKQC